MSSYMSPKVVMRSSPISGKGLFAVERIKKNELIVDYTNGVGVSVNTAEAEELYEAGLDHMIQVGDDKFFAATNKGEFEDADNINHSCEPNCGIRGLLQIVAMKDIEPGEEIVLDYAVMESSNYSFSCQCGSESCRHVVKGTDWQIPKLQERYKGYFSDYLRAKINPTQE